MRKPKQNRVPDGEPEHCNQLLRSYIQRGHQIPGDFTLQRNWFHDEDDDGLLRKENHIGHAIHEFDCHYIAYGGQT